MPPTGLQLLAYSEKIPEPYLEHYYRKNFLVLTTPPERNNNLMEANRALLDFITAYAVARQRHEMRLCNKLIEDMASVLNTEGMNYSEFASFWPVCDFSYSIFENMNIAVRKKLLRKLVEQYIVLRHRMYGLHGYTPTTLQVQADSFAHKHSGALGRIKITAILRKRGFEQLRTLEDHHAARNAQKTYMLPDSGGKRIFNDYLERAAVRFEWRTRHDGKLPDFVIFSNAHVFIVEHKHMKEGGGGQNKQIVELIDFVEQSERRRNIHYVAFLDGTMANTLLAQHGAKGKLDTQLQRIERALRAHPTNYFVNTAGFIALLDALAV